MAPKEGVFAHLRDSEEVVGRITDISPAGLGFEYVDLGDRMRTRGLGDARVSLLIRGMASFSRISPAVSYTT